MVITYVLAYNLTVWWLKIRNNVRRTEFSMLQRLPCLDKTGVMEITPAAAMEVLLGLLPLHLMTEAEVQVRIYRLMCTQQWRPDILTLVTPQNLGIWEHKPSLHMWSNRMLLRYAYHKPFTVKFPEKCKWQNGFN